MQGINKMKEVSDELNDQEESATINKERERIFDHFWTLEEQQTILGLLKGRKMKKKMKEEKEKNG